MARTLRRIAAAAALAAGVSLSGCATYVNYPSIDQDVAVNDPNVAPTPELCVLAVREVAFRWPVEGPYAVNFPRGMRRDRAERLVAEIDPDWARIVTSETETLPAAHVSRVWVRGDAAEVDVFRPVGEAGASQRVTVRLTHRYGVWRVTSSRAWPVGAGDEPPLYYWPEPEPAPAPEGGGTDTIGPTGGQVG
jgi:hypothetical protein